MFNSIDEVFSWLYNQKKTQKRENLDRIKKCIDDLELTPNYPIIHIAGTNGKGSCASYIKNILKLTGRHIGFFVSPYVVCFNERIEINDRYISNSEIMFYANKLYTYATNYYNKYNDTIPFFELTFLMALMFYKDRNIDLAVIECGVGGLLDATNVLNTSLAIITNVGFDHMNTLGNTLDEIANHKLGIVKENMTCLSCVCDELKPKFINYAKAHNNKMIFVDQFVKNISVSDKTYFEYKNEKYSSSLLANYQAYNASLAIEAVKFIEPSINNDIINLGLNETYWPGRMEIISKNPLVILDGAHNIHGVCGLVDSIKQMYPNKKINVLFSALHDKAFDKMLAKLDEITSKYYFTTINDKRASDPEEFSHYTSKSYYVLDNLDECLKNALGDRCCDLLLVTGSLHFISVVREKILKKLN